MNENDIVKIVYANPTNRHITQHLDEQSLQTIIGILEKLNANDFKEINPNATFDYTDIPIPYNQLQKSNDSEPAFSKGIQKDFIKLLKKINTKGTNIEYPFIMQTEKNMNEYSKLKPFETGSSQTCQYDWAYIEDIIKNSNKKLKLSLVHTHPNPLDNQFTTLFNKYKKELSELGVKPNGLNISLADVYATQYLQMLAEKYGKDISTESVILMYDGTLISFTTNNGITLTSERNLEQEKNKKAQVKPVDKDDLNKIKKELHPKSYNTTSSKTTYTQAKELDGEERSL